MGFAFTLLIIFLITWLLSPIVLLIVCLSQRSVIKQLRRENDTLRNGTPAHGISAQSAAPQNIPQPKPQPITDYKDLYEKPVQEDVQPVQTAEAPQNVPENVHDISAEIPQPETAAPTQHVMTAPQPATPAAEKKNGISTINIVLILGSLFVTLAGFIFAVAAWGVSNTFFKTVILVSFSAVFFGVSAFTERKLKLEATGKVFFTLGSVFLPAAVAAAGALGLFGEYLSFDGDGKLLVLTMMSAILSLCFFIGANRYDSKHFAGVAYGALSFAAVFLIMFAFPEKAPAALALSLYSIAALLLEPVIVKGLGEKAVTRTYHSFARLNVWVLAVLSLFLSDGEPLFTAPAVIFSASMLISPYICKSEKHSPAGIYGFAVYLMLGTMLGIRPDSFGDLTMTAAFVMIVYTCLVMMDVVPQEIRSILGKISGVMFCIIIAAGIIEVSGDFLTNEAVNSDLSVVISAAAVTLQTLIISLRNGSSVTKTGFYAAFVWAVLAAVCYFDNSFIIAAAAAFLLFAVLKLIPAAKKLYAPAQDVIACTALLFFTACADSWQMSAAIWAMSLIAAFISGKNLVFGRIAAPVITFAFFLPLLKYAHFLNTGDSIGAFVSGFDYAMMSSVVFCIIAAVTLLKPLRKYAKAFSLGIPLAFLSYFMQMIFGNNETASMVIISAVTVYSALDLISKYKDTGYISYSNFFLTSLLIAAYQTGRFFLVGGQALIFPSVALMFMLGVYILPMLDGSRLSRCLGSFLLRALPVYGVIEIFVLEEYGSDVPLLVCAWLLIIGGAAVARMRKDSVLMYLALPIALIYTYSSLPTLAGNDYSQYIFAFIAAAVLGVSGRFLYMEKAFSKKEWKSSDFLSVSAAVCPLMVMGGSDSYILWVNLIVMALILLNFIRKEQSSRVNRGFMTAAMLFILPIWWEQPFFKLPDIFEREWNIIPAVIACVLLKILHPDHKRGTDNISFAVAIFCLITLFADAADFGYPADAVMLGMIIFMILGFSFFMRMKRWFVLSVASAAAEALILTAKLWDSSAWWLYLLIAGVILIVLGITNEVKKQKVRNGELDEKDAKLTRFMSDWKW